MVVINIANQTDLANEANEALTEETTFRLAAGVYPDFIWPRNITNFPLIIEPQNRANPPTIRGWKFGGGGQDANFDHLSGGGSTFQDITFDGLLFSAQRWTSAVNEQGQTRSLIMPDGQGIGWRICGTAHPNGDNAPYHEGGGTCGLNVGQGCSNFLIKNCTFNGYSNTIRMRTNTNNITFVHNHFFENCEDIFKLSGYSNLTIEYNLITAFRGPTATVAQVLGWDNDEPPHADWIQMLSEAGSNLTCRFNYLHDTSYRLHGLLVGNQAAWGINQNVNISNNHFEMSHRTAMLIGNCNNLTVDRNKVYSVGPEGPQGFPALEVRADGNNTNVTYTNNTATVLFPGNSNVPAAWTFSGNTRNNNISSFPSGFVQVREDLVDPGDEFAGPYGTGDEDPDPPDPPTTPVALETGDAYFNEWAVDPELEVDDPRRTPVFEIDPASPAHDAFEIRWAYDTDVPPLARATTLIAGTGPNGGNLYRATSNGETHLSLPSETKTFFLYYHEIEGGPRSERSTVSFTEEVPTPGSNPVRIFEIDFSLYESFWVNDEEIERLVCENVVRWTKAGGQITDSTGYMFNTLSVVDTLPAGNIQPPGVLYAVRL